MRPPVALSPVRTQLELFDLCKRADALRSGATADVHAEAAALGRLGYAGVLHYVRTGDTGGMEERLLRQAKQAGTCRHNAPWPTGGAAESGWVYLLVGNRRDKRRAHRRSQSLAAPHGNRAEALRALHNGHNAASMAGGAVGDKLAQSADSRALARGNTRRASGAPSAAEKRHGGSAHQLDSSDGASSGAASIRCPACGHAFHAPGSGSSDTGSYDRH